MAAAANPRDRREEFLVDEDPFRSNAFRIIVKMLELNARRPDTFVFVDEVLHSIFFLGSITTSGFSPNLIVNIPEIHEALKTTYPRPFELFSSQVPKRSPFSCVLDMVVQLTGEREERNIIRQLRNIIREVDPSGSWKLVSSTICVSQKENSDLSPKYYGVSMATEQKRILVGASCLTNWHPFVANAVMTYYPKMTKKYYFDGTFTLRPEVRCQAFDLSSRQEEEMAEEIVKPPCRSCGDLYGLATNSIKQSFYGNCAEAESLSNLLKQESDVDIIEFSRENSERNLQRVRDNVRGALKNDLQLPKGIHATFYTPE